MLAAVPEVSVSGAALCVPGASKTGLLSFLKIYLRHPGASR